ncbi:30S ribosome-binding factor RbfA [Planctomycetota bacterium]
MSNKKKRVESLLAQEIPAIVQRELSDPRLGFITITQVEVASDYRSAKVYFSALAANGEEEPENQIKAYETILNNSAGVVQRVIAATLNLRFTPRLRFIFSDSLRKAMEMSDLIRKARASDLDHIEEDPESDE